MATVETRIGVPPERVFQVLADPRSYGHWVVGSRQIHAADPAWPEVGSAFDHTAGVALLKTRDSTWVEEMEENRLLSLRAKARPFGTAYVRLELIPEPGGTRISMFEGPGDRITARLFGPLADWLIRRRNTRSLARLEELVTGSVPIPGGPLPPRGEQSGRNAEPAAGDATGFVEREASELAAGFGRGVAAGLAGAGAMSVSTALEMRITGRDPSDVPAQALRRLLGMRRLPGTASRRLTSAAHLLTGATLGGAYGALHAKGLRSPYGPPALFTLAMAPDAAAVPALGVAPPPWRWNRQDVVISVLHHGVFAATTSLVLSRLER